MHRQRITKKEQEIEGLERDGVRLQHTIESLQHPGRERPSEEAVLLSAEISRLDMEASTLRGNLLDRPVGTHHW